MMIVRRRRVERCMRRRGACDSREADPGHGTTLCNETESAVVSCWLGPVTLVVGPRKLGVTSSLELNLGLLS